MTPAGVMTCSYMHCPLAFPLSPWQGDFLSNTGKPLCFSQCKFRGDSSGWVKKVTFLATWLWSKKELSLQRCICEPRISNPQTHCQRCLIIIKFSESSSSKHYSSMAEVSRLGAEATVIQRQECMWFGKGVGTAWHGKEGGCVIPMRSLNQPKEKSRSLAQGLPILKII